MIKKDDWKPVDGLVLEKNAEIAVKSDKNLLVVAGPGTGKTEMLAQRANYLFETGLCRKPYNILAISFKKDSASNLLDRVSQRSADSSSHRFDSMTYDALAKRILDQFRNALDVEMRPNSGYLVQDKKTLREMVRISTPFGNQSDWAADQTWNNFSFLDKNLNGISKRLGSLMLHGSEKTQASLTYHGIMQLAIRIIESNPQIRYAFRVAYPYVFLDEFQDTTDLQYQFIKTLFWHSNAIITAVGDDKQRIMDFAGASKTIFSDFKNNFSAVDLSLVVNHRSAPRIVNLQTRMYDVLQAREDKASYASNWQKDDGEINLIQADDEDAEARAVASQIKTQIQDGISAHDIAILVKQHDTTYAPPIIDELKKLGVKSRVESNYQSLLKEPLVKIVLQSILFALTTGYTEGWEEYYAYYSAFKGITDAEDQQVLYDADRLLNEFFKAVSAQLNDGTSVRMLVQNIIHFWTKDFFRSAFTEYSNGSNLEDTTQTFTSLLEKERLSNDSWNQTVQSFLGKDSVPIMTIHGSKGLEFQAVYLLALDDDAFWSFGKEPDETRRAFFVAISRPKQYLTFTFAQQRSNTKHPGAQSHDLISEFYSLIKPFLK